jgi:hypothetical protein
VNITFKPAPLVPRGGHVPVSADHRRGSAHRFGTLATACLLTATACSTPAAKTPATGPGGRDPGSSLKNACPATVTIQTGWFPEATAGGLYQLVGANAKIDAAKKQVSAELMDTAGDGGQVDTGIRVELRSGGPALDFRTVAQVMQADSAVTLGVQGTAEQVAAVVAGQHYLAVFAALDVDPLVYMWDQQKHPEFQTLFDVGQTDTPVLTFPTDPSSRYLVGSGILRERQLQPYDGSPTRFIAEHGSVVVGGYSTKDPYEYQANPRWKRPVAYGYVADAGWPNYPLNIVIRSADRPRLDGCLRRLVPLLQRATAAFVRSPDSTLRLMERLNVAYQSVYPYDVALGRYGVSVMLKDGLVADGGNRVLGDFDTGAAISARIARMIFILRAVYTAQRQPMQADLSPSDLATNDYLDQTIGLQRG